MTDQWVPIVDEFCQAVRRRYSDTTRARMGKQLRRFGREVGKLPCDVTAGDVSEWFEGLEVDPRMVYGYRTALRTFFGWASRAGRVRTDPMHEAVSSLAKPVPTAWGGVLDDYRRHMWAAGHTIATVNSHLDMLRRFARQSGLEDPWQASTDVLVDWLAGHRWARETLRSNRNALRAFYAWAYESGWVPADPAVKLPHVKAEEPHPHPAPETAYRGALEQADGRTGLMVRLAAEMGLRRAEVAGIHSRDVSIDGDGVRWLTVHGKGGKDRDVPMPRALGELVAAQPAGWLFPGHDGGHLSPRWVGNLVSATLPAGVTMHALRHRFATRAYNLDRDVFTVQRLLGHASPATTQRYVATDPGTMRQLVEAIAQ